MKFIFMTYSIGDESSRIIRIRDEFQKSIYPLSPKLSVVNKFDGLIFNFDDGRWVGPLWSAFSEACHIAIGHHKRRVLNALMLAKMTDLFTNIDGTVVNIDDGLSIASSKSLILLFHHGSWSNFGQLPWWRLMQPSWNVTILLFQ